MDTGADIDSSEAKVSSGWFSVRLGISSVWESMWLRAFCVSLQDEEDYDVMQDPEFLQSVLENLPGVDPNNEAIRNAMGSLASQTGSKSDPKKDEEKKKWAFWREEIMILCDKWDFWELLCMSSP